MNALLLVFKENPALWLGVVAFMGLTVGSFLNVVIHRLPLMMERAWREGMEELESEASQADAMEVNGDIPVISWLMLRGKCSSCATPISARYPAVEFVTMLLSLLVAWHFGPTPQALLGIVATWYLVAMTMIDYDTYLLPDSLTLQLMWIGLLGALVPVFTDLQSAVVGAALGYALLGWQVLPTVILLSSLVGAVVGLSLIAFSGRDKSKPIPFGPYLAAAGFIAMLWGEQLTEQYFSLIS